MPLVFPRAPGEKELGLFLPPGGWIASFLSWVCFAQKGPKASAPSRQDRSMGCVLSVGRSETGEDTMRFQCCAGGAERPLDGDVVPAGPCNRWALEEGGRRRGALGCRRW